MYPDSNDRRDYAEAFERDLVEADREIVIASPGLRRNKVERLITLSSQGWLLDFRIFFESP